MHLIRTQGLQWCCTR